MYSLDPFVASDGDDDAPPGDAHRGPRHAQPAAVDLSLARTYIPGFSCLVRGTALILIIAKFPRSVPAMMALATVLYVDASVRAESIFDSGSMLAAILATHALNVFRSDPASHQLYLSSSSPPSGQAGGGGAGFSPPSSIQAGAGAEWYPNAWGRAAQAGLCATSLLSLVGVDAAWLAATRWGPSMGCRSAGGDGVARAATAVVNGVLLMGVLQSPVESPDQALHPTHVIVRGYAFLALCLVWTYGVGVGDMVRFLAMTARPAIRKGNRGLGKHVCTPTIVQSFAPCHLRFTHLLVVCSQGYLAAAGSASALVVAWHVYWGSHRRAGAPRQEAPNAPPMPRVHPEYVLAGGGSASPPPYGDDPAAGGEAEPQRAPAYVSYAVAAAAPQPVAGSIAAEWWTPGGLKGLEPLAGGMSMAPSPLFTVSSAQHHAAPARAHTPVEVHAAPPPQPQTQPQQNQQPQPVEDFEVQEEAEGGDAGDAETMAMFEMAMRARAGLGAA